MQEGSRGLGAARASSGSAERPSTQCGSMSCSWDLLRLAVAGNNSDPRDVALRLLPMAPPKVLKDTRDAVPQPRCVRPSPFAPFLHQGVFCEWHRLRTTC